MLVAIGVPSFKRPEGLRRLLDSFKNLKINFDCVVIVAENDSEGLQAKAIVDELFENSYPFRLVCKVVHERGISQARNALLNVAFKELNASSIAMIDDDEWADEKWLTELVEVQERTRAHVVSGKMIPIFEPGLPSWAIDLPIYFSEINVQTGLVDMVHGTTNVLISKSLFDDFGPIYFDTMYSVIGGGDKEYFYRVKMKGGVFAHSQDALSYELFTGQRVTQAWALERAFRIGSSDVSVILKNKISRVPVEIMRLTIAALYASLCIVVTGFDKDAQFKHKMRLSRQCGKVVGFFGYQKKVYSKIHGA